MEMFCKENKNSYINALSQGTWWDWIRRSGLCGEVRLYEK